ncbi:hypothetical protein NO995_09815 [Aestuariibaculum sp. M13]|uniref:hypothetical protein n=1 Tax=Aestuariibaculum sp. M13 TaxID=2967132 RepID=UPI002159EC4C|nr:hypothetical protein [Aestuariibaculum sp. M13]MCR8667977.1 hypothetical protein [Aestuariibaculum sp. M13]
MWFTNLGFSQDRGWEFHRVILDDIVVTNINGDYLAIVQDRDVAKIVRKLEYAASRHNVLDSPLYDGRDEEFRARLTGTKGFIDAYYDKEGKILSTSEKYNDIEIPEHIRYSVYEEFPDWSIDQVNYSVLYDIDKSVADKTYKVTVKKGNKTKKLKLDSEGSLKY